jgi:transposase
VTLEEEVAQLRAENAELKRLLAAALARIAELEQQLAARSGKPSAGDEPPPFVRPSRPKLVGPKPLRKKRDQKHNHARRREAPTRLVEHALERCPECSYRLRGQSLDYRRQVIELPEPLPVEVIEHRVIRRRCPKCQRWRSPKLDLASEGQVLGRGRIGTKLVSLIATLRHALRLPFEQIQAYLATLHGFRVSLGELVYLLNQARDATKTTVEGLKAEMQASEIVHADETGWREDGVNGYLWSFATPGRPGKEDQDPVRYYEHDQHRSQAVAKRILGERSGAGFKGVLVSDFYAGYNEYSGKHQRCWVHLLRALHELKEKHPENPTVEEWAVRVGALHDEAKAWLARSRDPSRGPNSGPRKEDREQEYASLVERAHQLGLRYARDKVHPCGTLAKRLLRHEDELFQFVLIEGLASDNNLAERSIRPMVVGRKISGGTRSGEGTAVRMALSSLFETWRARGLNPFHECLKLLSGQKPAPVAS